MPTPEVGDAKAFLTKGVCDLMEALPDNLELRVSRPSIPNVLGFGLVDINKPTEGLAYGFGYEKAPNSNAVLEIIQRGLAVLEGRKK